MTSLLQHMLSSRSDAPQSSLEFLNSTNSPLGWSLETEMNDGDSFHVHANVVAGSMIYGANSFFPFEFYLKM